MVTIHMATSECSSADHEGRWAGVRQVESIPPGATVRHVDQLPPEELEALLTRLDGDGTETDSLDAGSVVVFTDYLQLE